jgi:hypothetical protein
MIGVKRGRACAPVVDKIDLARRFSSFRAALQNVALRCRDLPHCPHRAPVT